MSPERLGQNQEIIALNDEFARIKSDVYSKQLEPDGSGFYIDKHFLLLDDVPYFFGEQHKEPMTISYLIVLTYVAERLSSVSDRLSANFVKNVQRAIENRRKAVFILMSEKISQLDPEYLISSSQNRERQVATIIHMAECLDSDRYAQILKLLSEKISESVQISKIDQE